MSVQPSRPAARETASRYRARMRDQGFRPLQLWVPDTRSPKFAAECRRQSLSIAGSAEAALESFVEVAAQEIEGWK